MTEQRETYVVDFDYRSDGGPHLVGPFETREAAHEYTDSFRGPGWEASFCVVPVTPVGDADD